MTDDELYAVEVAIGVVKRAQPEYRRVIAGLQSLADKQRAAGASEGHTIGGVPVDHSDDVTITREHYEDLLQCVKGASEGEAEPVAWQHKDRYGKWEPVDAFQVDWHRARGFEVRALFAAPPAPSVADAAGASEDARDAARWRHLRNCGVIVDFTHAGPWKFTDDADAAVDKLMARSAAINAASTSKTTERKKLCKGSHIMCEGREYCLGHPSCSELAKESGND